MGTTNNLITIKTSKYLKVPNSVSLQLKLQLFNIFEYTSTFGLQTLILSANSDIRMYSQFCVIINIRAVQRKMSFFNKAFFSPETDFEYVLYHSPLRKTLFRV